MLGNPGANSSHPRKGKPHIAGDHLAQYIKDYRLHKQPRNPQGGVVGTKFLTIVSPKNRAETNEHSPLMQ